MRKYRFAYYTKREEQLNAWSHSAGIGIGVVVGVALVAKAFHTQDALAVFSVVLYLLGMLSSYVSSTAYHALRHHSRWKPVLRKWDHAAIYWHIAGSYAPITLVGLRPAGAWGLSLFVFVWLCASVGTIVSFHHALKKHSNWETVCFVLMGLSVLVAFKPLLECLTPVTLGWIFAEGFFYVGGALFYSMPSRRYMHSVFHFFVLAGTCCHMAAVWHML